MPKPDRSIELLVRGLVVAGGRVLVCRDIKHGHCYLPGGHVEFGESAAIALAREFEEECGERVTVGALAFISEHAFVQRGKRRHEMDLVFHVERASGEVLSREPEIGFEWVDPHDLAQSRFLPAPLIPQIQAILDRPATLRSAPAQFLSDMA